MCEKTKTGLRWVVAAFVATVLAILLQPAGTRAAVGTNQQISFEGKLVNASGVNIADGTYNMEFKIYQDGTSTGGGTLKWTEDHLVGTSPVTITAGTFQVNLGAVTAFGTNIDWNQDTLWLSMQVGSTTTCTPAGNFQTNCGGDGEMSPYIRLTSVPYALNAGQLNGLTASQLVQVQTSPTVASEQSGGLSVSGNVITGGTLQASTVDTPASGTLQVGSTNTTGITLNKNTTITSGQTLTIGGQQVFSGTGILQAAAISSSVAYSNLAQVGTITAGTWNATAIGAGYGGTGQSTYTVGDLLYASAATTLSKLSDVATGSCLVSGGTATAPTWGSCANAALSNLASVAINTSLLPSSANAIDVGSSSLAFRSGYFGTGVTTPVLQSASGAALTITANASSTWSSTAALTVEATGTNILALDTTGGGTVNVGNTNAANVNIGASGSTANAASINVGITTGAAQTIDIGGTGTSGGSNSSTDINLQGGSTAAKVSSTGVTLQTFTNSSTALQVENASGAPILLVDTTNTTNLISNPGFEVGTTGWSGSGTGVSCAQNLTKTYVYLGLSSLNCNLASSGSTTATVTGFTQTLAAGSYTFSFYALSTAAVTLSSTVTFTGGGGTCTLNSTSVSTSFQRYYCSVTTTAATTGISFSTATTGTGTHIYLDSVQLQTGASVTPYDVGGIQLRGIITNPVAIQPSSDSSTAFQVTNAAGTRILTVDTESVGDPIEVQIGSSSSVDSTQVNLGLDSSSTYADQGGCTTTSNQGAIYYNTATNAIRSCVNGGWEDVVTTSGLGIMLFGVVPDSGSAPGDLEATSTAGVSGPCKVSWASATSVNVQACVLYSGGRKIVQSQVTVTMPAMATSTFTHLCYWSGGAAAGPITNATSWFTTTSTTESANLPTFNANNPVVCLATIKNSTSTANTIGQIFDTRVFTTSQKQFTNTSVAVAPGWLVITTTTDTTKVTTTTGTAPVKGLAGTVVAGNASAWASGGPNAIIATGGMAEVETTGGATSAYNYIENSTTAGYAGVTTTAPTTYSAPQSFLGLALTAYGSCATPSASACQGSILTNIRFM